MVFVIFFISINELYPGQASACYPLTTATSLVLGGIDVEFDPRPELSFLLRSVVANLTEVTVPLKAGDLSGHSTIFWQQASRWCYHHERR